MEPRPGAPAPVPWLLLLVFLLSLPAVTTRIYASDEMQYFAYLRSLWFDRDVSFENEYQHFYDAGIARAQNFHETFLERTTETGRRINFATIGCGAALVALLRGGRCGVQVANMEGARIPRDGYSRPYIAAVAYASAFYGLLALLLSAQAVRLLARALARARPARDAVGRARVDRHAAAVLHVRRAADVARDVRVCGRVVHRDLAARPRHLVGWRADRARRRRRR